jgi:hypothetical protein
MKGASRAFGQLAASDVHNTSISQRSFGDVVATVSMLRAYTNAAAATKVEWSFQSRSFSSL